MVYRICCFLSNGEGTFIIPALYLRNADSEGEPREPRRSEPWRAVHLGGQAGEPVLSSPGGWDQETKPLPPPEGDPRADCWEAASLGVSDAQGSPGAPLGDHSGSCLPCIPRWPARRLPGEPHRSLINHSVAPRGDQPTVPHLSSLTCRILTLKRSMAFPWRAPGLPKGVGVGTTSPFMLSF